VNLENTRPFTRELGGRLHVFAHSGHLDIDQLAKMPLGRYRPIGETDSERAFCALLARLEPLWFHEGLRDGNPPTLNERREVLESFASDLRLMGIGNFLYSDGELLIAHSHERRQSDGKISPPGLHFLCRH
jgi:glutamine amidotransferase